MVPRYGEKRTPKKVVDPRSSLSPADSHAGPRPSSFVLGETLEYRIARLHLFMGYFVRRGCPIYTVAALDRATDLDVLAIRYIEPFQRQMIIAECKSGDNAPLDRIFWLSGVKRYTNADEALLVRKTTKWNIKDFAKESGVRILDLHRLAEIEASLGINDDEWPGVSDREFFRGELDSWNTSLKASPRFWELTLTLTSEVRWEEPSAGANYLLAQLRLLTRTFPQVPKDSFHRFLLTESLVQLSIFLLRLVEQCFDLGEKDRHGLIRKGLTYGNLDAKYAERILESAYNLSRQSVLHYTNRAVDIERQVFSMPEPPGTDQIVGFVDSLVKGYPACLIFPQVCDYVLLERFTKRKEMRRMLRRMFPQATLNISINLAQLFITTMISIGACPSYMEEIFSRPDVDQPLAATSFAISQQHNDAEALVTTGEKEGALSQATLSVNETGKPKSSVAPNDAVPSTGNAVPEGSDESKPAAEPDSVK